MSSDLRLGIIGLGYVGLPLAVEFGKKVKTIGFDIDLSKVNSCREGKDPSRELTDAQLRESVHAVYTDDPNSLGEADIIIVAVPTPIDSANIPDFRPLIGASRSAGRNMKQGAIVVYESTVYPGATEEICIPILEEESGLKWKKDFFVGYSPERINPGDRERTLTKIVKIVSGDTSQTLDVVAKLYEMIIVPGVYRASSIRTAEAAKVIENTQRDLNIALMNELSVIFNRLDIDTSEVLEAAGTKWNFLKFKPGLVGGHCIGVDPYYLTYKAKMVGYHPEVILAGRRINDNMGKYIAEQTVKQLIATGSSVYGAKVNVLGLTFKENCGDLRNSKVIDIIGELQSYGLRVDVSDPHADASEAMHEYAVDLRPRESLEPAAVLVVAVSHNEYASLTTADFEKILKPGGVLVDVKAIYDPNMIKDAGFSVWRL